MDWHRYIRFSIGLINERILSNFKGTLSQTDIEVSGQPETVKDARELAQQDPFEFEKWVCGKLAHMEWLNVLANAVQMVA